MTVPHSLRIVRERWLTVVIVLVIGTLTASATWYLRPKEFTSSLTLYVSAQPAYTTQSVLQSTQLSPPMPWSTRVTSYVELLSSPRVSDEVIQRLGLAAEPEDLAKQITAASATDSVLIDVAITDRSATRAAEIANVVGSVFPALVDELERPRTPDAASPVAVRIVRPAVVPTEPSSLGLPVMLALGLLSGAAIGVGVALARNAFDTPVRPPAAMNGKAPGRTQLRARANRSAPAVRDRARGRVHPRSPTVTR